jgi:hypothetical protein
MNRKTEYQREWRASNSDYAKEYDKKYRINYEERRRDLSYMRRYGISLEEYNQRFIVQNGKCAICSKSQMEFKRRFHVDHDHETGKVRGLLCENCNHMLGHVFDNITILESAIIYLQNHSKERDSATSL